MNVAGNHFLLFRLLFSQVMYALSMISLRIKKVLILAGPSTNLEDTDAILGLSNIFHAPILGDPLSNMRRVYDERVITSYDALLSQEVYRDTLRPDCILQIGQMVVSKRVQQWVASMQHIPIISVSPTMDYTNPAGNTTLFVQSTPQGWLMH